jgi:beta-glucosidase
MKSPMKLEISLYPFFCGQSLTSLYEYTDLAVGRSFSDSKDLFTISLSVKNIGNQESVEVARLSFLHQFASGYDANQLRRFEKVSLKPGESKNIQFVFNPEDVLPHASSGYREMEVVAGELKRKIFIHRHNTQLNLPITKP